MEKIVKLKLERVANRLKTNQNLEVSFADPVISHVVEGCTAGETGARNIDAIIDRNIVPEISNRLLSFMADEKQPAHLMVDINKKGQFIYTFKDKVERSSPIKQEKKQ